MPLLTRHYWERDALGWRWRCVAAPGTPVDWLCPGCGVVVTGEEVVRASFPPEADYLNLIVAQRKETP